MTIHRLLDAWLSAGAYYNVNPPATEAQIQAAEAKIGVPLPHPLREVYLLFNGGWVWELQFFPLASSTKYSTLTHSNEDLIEDGLPIPLEIRLFAHTGGEEFFGIWLGACGNPIYNHPIIEVGELFDEGCMGVVGTNLLSFLRGWSAYYLMLKELDKSKEVEFLDKLQVPQWLRTESFDENQFAQLRKWADPLLPDPAGSSYTQEYTIADLKRIFGVS